MFWFCLVLSCCVWLCWLCFVWFCRVVFGLVPMIFHRFSRRFFNMYDCKDLKCTKCINCVWYSSIWPSDAVSLQTWLWGCAFFWPLSVDQLTQNNKFKDELKHYLIVKYMFFDWKIAIGARISFRFVGLLDWWFALWYFVEILDCFLLIVFLHWSWTIQMQRNNNEPWNLPFVGLVKLRSKWILD